MFRLRNNEAVLPCTKIAQSTSALLVEFQQGRQWVTPKQRIGPERWQSPIEDLVKVNFDGAMFREDQEAGIGMVIRNKEGQVLVTFSKKVMMQVSVEILEMLAA